MTRPQGAVTLGSERHATSGPSPYSQDLSAGLCVGVPDFTERPLAMQYAFCIQCPVAALCPSRTPWPREVVCARGHVWDGESRICRTCAEDKKVGRRTPPNVTLEALDGRSSSGAPLITASSSERVAIAHRMRRLLGKPWPEIIRTVRVPADTLASEIAAAGDYGLSHSLRLTPIWRAARIATIERLTAQGLDGCAIADHLGASRPGLHGWLIRVGRPELWKARRPGRPGGARSTPTRDATVELASQGLTVDMIGQRLGVQPDAIKKRLYRAGRSDLIRCSESVRRRSAGRRSA